MQIKYIFFSKRLGFRAWLPKDIAPFAALSSDPVVMKYFPEEFWLDREKATRSIERFNKHLTQEGFTYFAVDLLEDHSFIGFIGMKTIEYEVFFAPAIDIGWRLDRKFWGRGLATEGALRCMDWFFSQSEEEKLVSLTVAANKPSENVMKKIGMKKVTDFDHPLLENGHPMAHHVLYEINKKSLPIAQETPVRKL